MDRFERIASSPRTLIEGRPPEYYAGHEAVGVFGDMNGNSRTSPIESETIQPDIAVNSSSPGSSGLSQIVFDAAQRVFTPAVERVLPVAHKIALMLGAEPAAPTEPKSVIAEFDLEGGENVSVPVDEVKPIAKPKDDPDKHIPPYEYFEDGVRQALVNFAINFKHEERYSQNQIVGSVGAVLLDNNGEASVAEVAAITELSEDFVRGFDALTGVFEVYPHPDTGEDMIRSEYYSGLKVAKKDGWTVVVPVSAAD